MRSDKYHVVNFQQSHWLRVKIPSKCCQGQLFLSVVVLLFCCQCERSKIILVEIFSDMCCLEDNASCNCQTNTFNRDRRSDCWMREEDIPKRVGNFLLLRLVQVSCNSVQQEGIWQWKKNSWVLFCYMN